ncbi:hypothetical protein [Leifsonia sp. fls2-241-R2A-40a]|uniref:hypothetical protein n=1 Tax=Leifsonia sp. fls2-241-R2A-40a TaxID=3040290 RepID=UPI0025508484|nr:hypothetical protein [Leifsonia sp. fls2-241-R2A-40a]
MTSQPLRLGPLVRRRLARLARRDAAAAHDTDAGRGEATTPTVATLQARADAYARREEQRFFRRMRSELTEHRVLTSALRTDLDAYDERLDRLPEADRFRIAEAQGAAFEELRRLERRIRRAHRRTDELSALINARFTAAQLRAARMFDRSDEAAAVYWGALRQTTSGRVAPQPPTLRRSDWLTSRGTAVDALHPIAAARTAGEDAAGVTAGHDTHHRRTDAPA